MPAILKALGTGGNAMVPCEVKVSVSGVSFAGAFAGQENSLLSLQTLSHFHNAFLAINPLLRNPVQEIWVSLSHGFVYAVGPKGAIASVTFYEKFNVSAAEKCLLSLFNKVFKQESW